MQQRESHPLAANSEAHAEEGDCVSGQAGSQQAFPTAAEAALCRVLCRVWRRIECGLDPADAHTLTHCRISDLEGLLGGNHPVQPSLLLHPR